jgi:hypothetical protein
MSEVPYCVALPFVASDDGIAPGEAIECFNPNAAVMKAEALSRKPGYVGAIAFSRSGDPATGDFGDAKLIRKFGDVPDDLSALCSPLTPRANARGRNAAFPSSRPALADRCRSRRDCRPTTRGWHHECSSVRRSPARPRR